MYRFLKTQYVSLPSVCFLSNGSSVDRLRLCSFCKVHHSNMSLGVWFIKKRYYGTTINDTEIYYPIKKKSRAKRKYTELLEVTDQATSNKKAAVKKLNASHLSMLVNLPHVTLDKLHKFKQNNLQEKWNKNMSTNNSIGPTNNKEHVNVGVDSANFDNFENHTDREDYNYKDTKQSESSRNSSFLIITDTQYHTIEKDISNFVKSKDEAKTDESLQNKQIKKKKKMSETMVQTPNKETEKKKFFSENVRNVWLAQMDVYITCKMFSKARKMIEYSISNRTIPSQVHADLCNMLLDGYCMEKDTNNVLKLYNIMINNSAVNPQTYATVFEYIGKMENKILQRDIFKKMESDMLNNNISFNDIFNKTKFKLNQVGNVLKTIQLFKPKYQPTYVMPEVSYNCKLMNNISEINLRESPVKGALGFEQLTNCLQKQINQEKECSVYVQSIEKIHTENSDKTLYHKQRIANLESSWKKVVLKAFERNVTYLEQKESTSKPTALILHPFLKVLQPEKYVDAIIQEVKNLVRGSEYFTAPLPILHGNLGFVIYRQYEMQTKENYGIFNKTMDIYHKYLKWYASSNTFDDKMVINNRIAWQKFVHENQHYGASIDKECIEWPYVVYLCIGKFLYNIIINEIKINIDNQTTKLLKRSTQIREIPAFYTLFRCKEKIMTEQIKPHPILYKMYKDAQVNDLTFDATLIPSYCPPRPWSSINSGGYAVSKIDFMRTLRSMRNKQIQMLQSVPLSSLYPPLDALNQLGSIPWKVNTQVLDVIIKVFQEGGSVKLNVPQPPKALTDDMEADGHIFSKQRMDLKQRMNEMHSLWCDCLYKLSLANHFRNDIFWLPHNIDFRGRAYPVPPHLTHLGSDLARSILIFAQGKVLGPQGLDWLKIHTINLTGLMKRESIKNRLKFANENIDKIVDSAENPLTGNMWWAESDEPWQTLASCIEVANALKSPNPEKYVSSFPVHQDGSCNGLQHYAALGRDQIGAESVNLYPSDTPQDVYSVVAAMVESLRAKDASNNVLIAQILEGHIKRKVIKQTIMTTVYGVTKFGARLQIQKQLKDLETFPQNYVWEASTYLSYKTFESLRTMFTSARTIQEWLTTCAHIISTTFNEQVEWITPLGLPVLQPYTKLKKYEKQNEEFSMEKIDTLKQKNAFPPNFIHSLDSTHMMLTSLFCEQAGITFMSVHDCFWTHPSSIDKMNKICREQFVALHSQPILEDLSKYLLHRYLYGNNSKKCTPEEKETALCYFNAIPSKGAFNLKNVLKSTYFFS